MYRPTFYDVGSELEMIWQLHTPASLPPEKGPTALNRGELSASRTGCFIPGERALCTHLTGGWVGPKASLGHMEK
jgi:hypothetical protein